MAQVNGQEPLSQLQRDILWLEEQSWKQGGNKLNEFKARHPTVTEVGYTVALLRLLEDRRAYELENGRYAPVLLRIQRLHADRVAARGAPPDVVTE